MDLLDEMWKYFKERILNTAKYACSVTTKGEGKKWTAWETNVKKEEKERKYQKKIKGEIKLQESVPNEPIVRCMEVPRINITDISKECMWYNHQREGKLSNMVG